MEKRNTSQNQNKPSEILKKINKMLPFLPEISEEDKLPRSLIPSASRVEKDQNKFEDMIK
jgi:hypothetical protein